LKQGRKNDNLKIMESLKNNLPFRKEALDLLEQYIKNPNLRRHALAVEAVMRRFAKKFAPSEEENWALAGLLHDLDWEQTQGGREQEHGKIAEKILLEKGYPQEIAQAVKVHNHALRLEPKTLMEKVLYSVEELTGLITAAALVNPEKLAGVKVKSLKKKFKSPSFAAGVNREVIKKAPEYLKLSLDEIMKETLEAMKSIRKELGL
jgi:hypothetical protein